jgi:hypothetical protein
VRAISRAIALTALAAVLLAAGAAHAQRISDVSSSKHNMSASGPGPVRATTESQVCVFCHTPHAAANEPGAPLWNRQLSGATYTPYTSNSIDADDIAATPGGASKLCLSCHDGTLAIGAVNVANGQANPLIALQGTDPDGTMPPGAGPQTGFTRDLGVDLSNDHPISFTYDSALALADGELRDPAGESHIGNRGPGSNPSVPLQNGRLECTSCHDPHIRDTGETESIKFLRLNRFQKSTPAGSSFSEVADIACLACHDKLGQAWADSAHADPTVAEERYKDAAASLREFGLGQRVWEASCLNCHDTHTVQGAKRLLREGTDALGIPKSGGAPALEEVCYQCHTTPALSVLLDMTQVPDIRTDFQLPRHMPLTTADQAAGAEVHDVLDADLTESQALLGNNLFPGGTLDNRHVECTDCHNPHRLTKNRRFNRTGAAVSGTHDHATTPHSNVASGVLRGSWGVEPVYGSADFNDLPSSYLVKQGDGGIGASTDVLSAWVTREYQICLKCHSDFGYNDDNLYPLGSRPDLGSAGGGTPSGTNGLTQYTNQARELQAPLFHKGEVTTTDSGAGSAYSTNNHRSWHPAIDDTGRSAAVRSMSASTNMFLSPWNGASIGVQTMYCSDCHGTATANGTVVPVGGEDGNPWGPHGSSNDFILKGSWDPTTGNNANGLCFRCHNHTNYATETNEGNRTGFESGFGGPQDTNLHAFHAKRLNQNLRCMWCHVAVPHGWKNKALLVNLNDVGPEAGLAPGSEVPIGSNAQVYDQEPYYRNAKLKILQFRQSGTWREVDCGSASGTQGTGRDWMRNVCENPP